MNGGVSPQLHVSKKTSKRRFIFNDMKDKKKMARAKADDKIVKPFKDCDNEKL